MKLRNNAWNWGALFNGFNRTVHVRAVRNSVRLIYKGRKFYTFLRDVIPTDPEDDFPHQVVRIAYSPEFKDCFDYFRAITEKGELSQEINPNYPAFLITVLKRNFVIEHKNLDQWKASISIDNRLYKTKSSELYSVGVPKTNYKSTQYRFGFRIYVD